MRTAPLTIIAATLCLSLTSCGHQGTTVIRNGAIPAVRPDLYSREALDPKDPQLENHPSVGPVRALKLVETYQATLDPKLGWHYSESTSVPRDRPKTFDCEGYTRYVYGLYSGDSTPWPDYRSAQILDHPEIFARLSPNEARRGDLVVWRKADGWPNDHVAYYDGVVKINDRAGNPKQIAMIVSTSSSAQDRGEHVIKRFPLAYTMKPVGKVFSGPYFVQVR